MKNNEVIQITAMVVIAAALVYRKYFRNKKTGGAAAGRMPGKPHLTSHPNEEEYEPYSKKNSTKADL
jgi:hypothetical protein